ncbi:MAG: hypothetical protein U0X20_09050 [Caldilineaceae bacterium]
MAWQQRMETIKATRVDRTTVVGLIAGIILGLTLGLLIGWVWWPVEWQGPEPASAPSAAAGSTTAGQFNTPEARYLYLGATADAYVLAAAAGDRNAASLAAQRLAALGGDIRSAFDSAIAFYSSQAGGATQVSNLTTLAGAVGIPLGTSTSGSDTSAAAAPGGQPAVEAAAPAAAAATTGTAQGGGNPLQWLLSLLAAVLLIGGGLYLLWVLNQRRGLEASGASADGFDAEEVGTSSATVVEAFDRSSLTPMRATVTPAAAMRSTVERPVAVEGRDPHGFDAEDDDDEIYPPRRGVTIVDTDPDEQISSAAVRAAAWDDEDNEDEDGDDEGDKDDAPTDKGPEDKAGNAAPDAVPTSRTNAPGTSVNTAPPPTLQPPTPSRYDRYTTIDSYTATYYLGQVDFDQGKPIGSPSGDGYLGEYSVGIPQKNGLLDHDMEKPIAMEVVLFDKSDGRSTLTTTRLLLSDYAHDHMYDEYQRANPNLAPIVARPNTHFQLEGKQLLLDCLIKDVKYTRDGFFQNVVLELVVKRKA